MSTMQKHFSDAIRPLGSLEHLLWLLDQARPAHLAFTAEIIGTADPREWRAALDRVQERHPLLSARIEGAFGSIPRFYPVAGKPIPLRVVEAEPESRWQVEVLNEFATPFDPEGAPLIRAVLVQGTGRTALILSAHHSIIDGMSICFLIRDTLAALNGEALEPLPAAPSMDALVGLEETPAAPIAIPSPQAIPADYRLPVRPQMQNLRLADELTAALRQRAKQEATTVHAALLASIAIAGRTLSPRWREDARLRFLSPINNRKVLGVGEDCGIYASGATTTFPPEMFRAGGAGFWDLARHASDNLARARTREGIAAALAGLRGFTSSSPDVAAALAFASTVLAREAVLTNHGELPFGTEYGRLTLDVIWPAIISAFSGQEQIILAATTNGALCLTHSGSAPLPGLLEAMREVLAKNV